GKGEGVGKPPEDSGRGQEAAAVAKRDLGEEEELGRERLRVDEAGAGGVVVSVKGTGITLGVLKEEGAGVGYVLDGNRKNLGGAYLNMCLEK
ncbi:Phenylalanine--tRNA ligase alpha subunit, partial [Dissostichus eleginoides]